MERAYFKELTSAVYRDWRQFHPFLPVLRPMINVITGNLENFGTQNQGRNNGVPRVRESLLYGVYFTGATAICDEVPR